MHSPKQTTGNIASYSYHSPTRADGHSDPFIDPYQSNPFLSSYPMFYPSEQRRLNSLAHSWTLGGSHTQHVNNVEGEDKLRLLSSAGLLMGDMSGIVLNSPMRDLRHHNSHSQVDDTSVLLLQSQHKRPRSQSMSVIEGAISSFANVTRGKDPLSIALKKYIERGGIPGEGYIGIYSPEDRKLRIERFLEKRKHRMWTKKVKYDVRKVINHRQITFRDLIMTCISFLDL